MVILSCKFSQPLSSLFSYSWLSLVLWTEKAWATFSLLFTLQDLCSSCLRLFLGLRCSSQTWAALLSPSLASLHRLGKDHSWQLPPSSWLLMHSLVRRSSLPFTELTSSIKLDWPRVSPALEATTRSRSRLNWSTQEMDLWAYEISIDYFIQKWTANKKDQTSRMM